MARSIEPGIAIIPNPQTGNVVYGFRETDTLAAVLVSMKNKQYIIAYLFGTPENYSSNKVFARDLNTVNTYPSCKTVYYIDNEQALDDFRPVLEKTVQLVKQIHC